VTDTARRPRPTERAGRPPRPAPTAWWLSVAVLVAIGAALSSLSVLLAEGGWYGLTMTIASIAVAASSIARRFVPVWRGFWSLVAGLVALFAAVVVRFAADTTLLLVVPTPETFARFSVLIRDGELAIVEQAVPAIADEGLRFLLVAGVGLLAVLANAVVTGTHRPALLAIPLLGLIAIPVIVVPGALPLGSVLATMGAFLVALALHRPASSVGGAAAGRLAAAVAAVLVAAVTVPGLLPTAVTGALPEGTGPVSLVTGVNPVIELGDDLRRSTPVEALRYTTDVEGGLYLTLSHLAVFEGQEVQPLDDDVAEVELGALSGPSWLPDGVATVNAQTRIETASLRTQWLPVPSAPTAVSGLDGTWLVDPAGVTVRAESGVSRAGAYTVTSLLAAPTTEQLRAATVGDADLAPYRQIPDELDPSIQEAALAATAEARTPYEQALALQRFFTGGDFAYSEDAPVEGGYDGTGADIVAQFLVERSGYCVHFSSAMALMARTLDIPSRIAVGFLPGTRNPQVPNEYIVSSDNLHAWPELHFDGLGWVRFEPTPSLGTIPEYAADEVPIGDDAPLPPGDEEPLPDPSDPAEPTEPIDPPEPGEVTDPENPLDGEIPGLTDGSVDGEGPGDAIAEALADPVIRSTVIVGALVVLIGGLLVTPALWRAARRRRRMHARDPLDAWREVRDTARDLGLPAEATRTVRERAALWGVDETVLAPLVTALEARAYGDPERDATASPPLRPVLVALRAGVPWWRRVIAAAAPRSLLDREPDDAAVMVPALSESVR